jgi:hypothetical protein
VGVLGESPAGNSFRLVVPAGARAVVQLDRDRDPGGRRVDEDKVAVPLGDGNSIVRGDQIEQQDPDQ